MTLKTSLEPYFSQFPFGKNVVMPLPDPLNGHSSSKETISYAKDYKDYNKNDNECKTGLH